MNEDKTHPLSTPTNRISRAVLVLCATLLLSGGIGCGAPQSFVAFGVDVNKVAALVKQLPTSAQPTDKTPQKIPSVAMELPMVKARFCLERAVEHYEAARLSTRFDLAMLVTAGLAGGAGTSIGAATTAMEESGTRTDLGIASVTLLAAGGAVLGLRAALGLDNLGRTQRIAAARNVEAAINILEAYALAEDPLDVEEDGFTTCRDGDIEVAKAYPGPKSGEAIATLIEKAKTNKDAAKIETATAEAHVEEAVAAERECQDKVTELEKDKSANADAIKEKKQELVEKKREVSKAKVELAEARLKAAKAELDTARANVFKAGARLRRAVFFLTNLDVSTGYADLQQATSQVTEARAAVTKAEIELEKARAASTEIKE